MNSRFLFFKIAIVSTLLFFLCANNSVAQMAKESKVFLMFEKTVDEVNVDGEDALQMLNSYIVGKTNCIIVDSISKADYVLNLRVVEKNMGNRRGKLEVINNKTDKIEFESKWYKGTMNAFYGYSGSRHAIGKLVKSFLLKSNPNVRK